MTVDGPVVTEIYQEFSDWSSQIIRLIPGQPYVEFDWIVGPIPVKDNVGKEIITRFTVKDMKTRGIFYTDSGQGNAAGKFCRVKSIFSPATK